MSTEGAYTRKSAESNNQDVLTQTKITVKLGKPLFCVVSTSTQKGHASNSQALGKPERGHFRNALGPDPGNRQDHGREQYDVPLEKKKREVPSPRTISRMMKKHQGSTVFMSAYLRWLPGLSLERAMESRQK
jgi:hypothetical protein